MVFSLKKAGIKSKNIPLIWSAEFFGGILFFLPVMALYLEESLFNLTNVAIVFAVGSVTSVILEIPTGAIGDLLGRKRTLILDFVFTLFALLFYYIGGSMTMFILGSICGAIGNSLNSGTESAMLYDSLKEEDKENYYKKVTGIKESFWAIGASIGSFAGGFIAKFGLDKTILYTFIPSFIGLILISLTKEPKYQKEEHKNLLKHSIKSTKEILNNPQIVLLIIGAMIMWGLGESEFNMIPIYFDFKEIPIESFGIVVGLMLIGSSLGHYISHDVSKKFGDKVTLIISSFAFPTLVIISTFLHGFFAASLLIITSIFFGIKNPIIEHWINEKFTSNIRATVLSISSFANEIMLAACFPIFGYIADFYDINIAFRIYAVLFLIAPFMYFLLKQKGENQNQF